ncbi:hypothetical protein I3J27_17840 [Bradyrhizobium xenonodulans]|uniref:Uncharacterized protein n=1 Tax=Bradyrhizobium xenonodulans TaxID=2736875 RepID=A0ABY7MXK6_9BRAD|nr:hypothetical protein [Bradyrhizobium xenonodulans]WBL82197.1 hypothetical protein I3J27_17840 [Bradyrhizobium xenonodulans]
MNDLSYPAAGPASDASGLLIEKKARNVFDSITAVLHCSRRLQARRILRQYEHLMPSSEQSVPQISSQNSGDRKMLVTSKAAQAKLVARSPARNEMGWLMAVALAFLVIHIVAGTIWMRASANETTTSRSDVISSSYD